MASSISSTSTTQTFTGGQSSSRESGSSASKLLSQAEVLSMPWEDLRDYAKERGLSAESRALLDYKLSTMSYEEIMGRTYELYSDIEVAKEKMRPDTEEDIEEDIEEEVKPIARKKRGGASTGATASSSSNTSRPKRQRLVTVITSIFRPNATADADGNNEPSHNNKDTSTTTAGTMQYVVRLLRSMSSYQRNVPRQPTRDDIDSLDWLKVQDVDDSFNSVDKKIQKRAKGGKSPYFDPPVLALIVDKESDRALKLCTTICYIGGDGVVYNQKDMSLWGVLELIGQRDVRYTVDAIEANNNEVMYGLVKVFFFNRKEDVPKDIKWHDTPEKRLVELKKVGREKGKKNQSRSKADGYVVHLPNNTKDGPSGEPLTAFRKWGYREGGVQATFSNGGFGAMNVKQKVAKAPGPEGMLFKNVFWITPCSEKERNKAKSDEDVVTIKRIVKKNFSSGRGMNKAPAVWVPSA